MSNQPINTGTTIGDGTGDGFHTSCLKINANFAELYARAPAGLSGLLAADSGTGNYRVAVIADISFAGLANGLATLDGSGKVPAAQLNTGVANGLASLDSGGKVPTSQLPTAVLGSVDYQTTWNASTNAPAIPAAASGNKGWYYKVATAGTTSIDGNAVWNIGDWIVSDGTVWERISNSDAIQSVAGLTGIITAAGLKAALTISYADVSGAAPITSPTFLGSPAAPTPATGNNSTLIATTAFGWLNYEALGKTSASNVQTASYVLALTDVGRPVRMNVASANSLTVPPNSSVPIAVDAYVNVEQYGAGLTSIVAGVGVTIRSRNGLNMGGQYAMATLHKIGTDEWMFGGDVSS